MDKKTIRDWFVFVLVLAFLPKDNKLALDFRPQDWYGEARITVGDQLLIIGKNSNADAVDLGLRNVKTALALQERQPMGIDVTNRQQALPYSLIVVSAQAAANLEADRRAYLGGKYYFSPGTLNIFTRADLYNTYLLLAIVVALFMVLGFTIARYAVDDELAPPNKA